ncbi:MAG: hypothetical protein U9R53_04925 [Chloroflexota bacterium]|nr:hypothetical protein [Chloroflexota bacterium]
MKRCEVCDKLTDNDTRFCRRCGTAFEYDPKVTPFSETRIILAILLISFVGWVIYSAIPLPLPDPIECSQTSYRRFNRIANQYYRDSKNVLRSEVLFTSELSELRSYRNDAEAIAVPPCLESAKADLVNYLDKVFYIGLYSMWGAYQAAAANTESAGIYWASFNNHMNEVKECLPNCP